MEFQGTVSSVREYQNSTFAASALPTTICFFLASQAALAVLILLPSGVISPAAQIALPRHNFGALPTWWLKSLFSVLTRSQWTVCKVQDKTLQWHSNQPHLHQLQHGLTPAQAVLVTKQNINSFLQKITVKHSIKTADPWSAEKVNSNHQS